MLSLEYLQNLAKNNGCPELTTADHFKVSYLERLIARCKIDVKRRYYQMILCYVRQHNG